MDAAHPCTPGRSDRGYANHKQPQRRRDRQHGASESSNTQRRDRRATYRYGARRTGADEA